MNAQTVPVGTEKYLDPKDVEGPVTKGEDYNGDKVTILGKVFTSDVDPNYEAAKKLALQKTKNVSDWDDLDDECKKMFKRFVFAFDGTQAAVFSYDPSGVQALK